MSCTQCDGYKTVGELFSGDFKALGIDLECSKRLPTLNKALTHLWAYAFLLPGFKKSEIIDVNGVIHITCEKIYMPVGFFGRGCGNCFIDDGQCDSCCQDGYKQIDMTYKESVPFIGNTQYTIQCPLSKNVEYKLPQGTQDAYFTYYRYFDTLIDENSIVPIPEYLEPALQMLLVYHAPNTEPADKVSLGEDFSNYIKQLYEVFKLGKQVPTNISFKLFK